mgnify:CR=1 FL=1
MNIGFLPAHKEDERPAASNAEAGTLYSISNTQVLFKETGSLGIRIAPNLHRGIAKREFVKKEFEINGETFEVTFKNGYVNGEIISSRAEYEDLKNKCNTAKTPKVSSKVKNELNTLKAEYEDLKNKYNAVVSENEEFKRIFDDIESNIDSDE